MRYTILIAIISLIFLGCKKVSFTTAPHLYLESVNTDTLNSNTPLIFNFTFTDMQGDADSIYIQKINPHCNTSSARDSLILPFYPPSRKTKGSITITYGIDNTTAMRVPQCGYNDTCYYQFVMADVAGNKSDTIKSGTIIIFK